MNKTLKIILGVIVVLAIAGASFYGGTVYGESQAADSVTAAPAGFPAGAIPFDGQPGDFQGRRAQGQGEAGGFAAPAGMTFGEIESIDGNTLTLTTQAGGAMTVLVTDTTLIEKNASVAVSDLVAGDTVIVSGSDNDDGSITARSVQVAPAGRFLGGNPGAAPGTQ